MPKLYLIPLPLATDALATIPAQVREVVAVVDVMLAEELRTARRFISSLRTGRKIEDIPFFQLDKKTPAPALAAFLKTVAAEQTVGVMSEAGCPGIADPGALAVQYAHRHGWEVVPLVGPSSIVLALMASGLNGQGFTFHGYLPIERADREKAIRELDRAARQAKKAQVFIETPFRNNQMLQSLVQVLPPDTLLCVATDLTGAGQSVRTQPVRDWKAAPLPDIHKIPTVFIVQ
jgi:16S rRNA (cytidine1402-2'-O)-methyltransferase